MRLPLWLKDPLRAPDRAFRHATRRARILPGFLIIGAQRAGTTSLFSYLTQHPDVVWARATKGEAKWAKELHFFDNRFGRGVDWYRAFFPLVTTRALARLRGGDLVATEATPSYLFHPAAPERVAATIPNVRLIAILRDPVDRAYSHYQLMVRSGREARSFEDALAAEEEWLAANDPAETDGSPTGRYRHFAYYARGLYAEQLERWLAHFPREQLLVLGAEEFAARPAALYARVLSFLGLRAHRPAEFPSFNRMPYTPLDPATRRRLAERFAEPNARLERLLGQKFGWGSGSTAVHESAVALDEA